MASQMRGEEEVRTPKGRKEFVEMWLKGRIPSSQAKRQYEKENFWDKCREFDAGKHWPNLDPKLRKNKMTVNLVKDANHKTIASILAQNPKPKIVPKIGDPEQIPDNYIPIARRAETMEKLISNVIDDNDGLRTFRHESEKAAYEARLSIGIMKDLYVPKTEPNPRAGQIVLDENGNEVIDPETGELMIEPDENVVSEKYGAEYVDPDMHLVDAQAEDGGHNMKWNGEEMLWPLAKVRAESMFKQSARMKVKATEEFMMSPEEMQFMKETRRKTLMRSDRFQTLGRSSSHRKGDKDPNNQLVRLYWVWDFETVVKNGREIRYQYVFSDGLEDDWLMRREWPTGVEGGIYSYLQYRSGGKGFYKRPPSWDLLDLNIDFNEAVSHKRVLRRRNIRKVFARGDAFKSDSEFEKLQNDTDLEIVETKGRGSVRDAINVVESGGASSADIEAVTSSLSLFTRMSTLSPENFGMSEASTLGQSRIQQGQSTTVLAQDHNKIIQFLGMVFKKIGQRMQANLNVARAFEYVGEDGNKYWAKVDDARQIEGEFEFSIHAESTLPTNSATERVLQDQALERIFTMGLSKFLKEKELVEELMKNANFSRRVLKSDPELQAEQVQQQMIMQRLQQELEGQQGGGAGKGGGQRGQSEEGIERSLRQSASPTSTGQIRA